MHAEIRIFDCNYIASVEFQKHCETSSNERILLTYARTCFNGRRSRDIARTIVILLLDELTMPRKEKQRRRISQNYYESVSQKCVSRTAITIEIQKQQLRVVREYFFNTHLRSRETSTIKRRHAHGEIARTIQPTEVTYSPAQTV